MRMQQAYVAWVCVGMVWRLSGCETFRVPVQWLGGESRPKKVIAGDRIDILPPAPALTPDTSLESTAVALPEAQEVSAWSQYLGSTSSHMPPLQAGHGWEEVTSTSVGDGESWEYRVMPLPVVADGKVFAMDAEGYISAHDARTLERVWQEDYLVDDATPSSALGGGLAYADGQLYAVNNQGVVWALDAQSGTPVWNRALHVPLRAAPRVSQGRILVPTIDSRLVALNTADGAVLWEHRGIQEITSFLGHQTPSVSGRMVIMPYASGQLVALSLDSGKVLWSDDVRAPQRTDATAPVAGIRSHSVIADDQIYTSSNSGMFMVHALYNGQLLWQQPIASQHAPWVAGNVVFVLTRDAQLVALWRRDGRVKWVTQLPRHEEDDADETYAWNRPMVINGYVTVTGAHGKVRVYDPANGTLRAKYAVPEESYTAPIVAGAQVYVLTQDARLHLLR